MTAPTGWIDAEINALRGHHLPWAGLVRVATPAPVRIWTGYGDLPIVSSAFDPDASIYRGGNRLLSFPAFQSLWNGLAERILVTLTGVTEEMRALAYEEAADVRGSIIRLGIVIFDGNWQQVGSIRWLRRGTCDVIHTTNRPGRKSGRIKTISFSLGSHTTGRRVGASGTYTDQVQKSYPGREDDRFCERTVLETQNHQIQWPIL